MLKCQILDDNPETCEKLNAFFKSHGIPSQITRNANIWARRSGLNDAEDGQPMPIAPLVIDNHLEDAISLERVGLDENERKDDAGFNILEKYLIPLIRKVIIPLVPIAIVSSADISDIRAEFYSQYGEKYGNVCFFSKEEEKGNGQQEAQRFLNLCKDYYKDYGANADDDTELALDIIGDIASDYQLSDENLRKIFNIKSGVSGDMLGVLKNSPTFDWKEKVVLLSQIDSLLISIFSTHSSPVEEANKWLRTERMSDGRTALETLQEGRIVAAQEVLERASFSITM